MTQDRAAWIESPNADALMIKQWRDTGKHAAG
jgi:hypothetical protein